MIEERLRALRLQLAGTETPAMIGRVRVEAMKLAEHADAALRESLAAFLGCWSGSATHLRRQNDVKFKGGANATGAPISH
jgi:hypothetical protein